MARATIPRSATSAQIRQVRSLIIRGKAGAVRGDPFLQRIANALADMGVQSVESQIMKREFEEQRGRNIARAEELKLKAQAGVPITQEELRRQGEVQPAPPRSVLDIPTKLIERVTGRKPREVFRFVTGSPETDVTRPLTTREVVVETATVPLKAISITGGLVGVGAGVVAERVIPEGVQVPVSAREEREVIFFEPTFGTIEVDPITSKPVTKKKVVTVPAREAGTITIFKPSRIETGVRVGTQAGLFFTAPALVISPGLVAEGVETALDPSLSKGERLLGIAEAELGLLIGGLKIKSLVKDLSPVKIREFTGISGKRARTGKQKQILVQKAKTKAQAKGKKKVTKSEVKQFLETDIKTVGGETQITILGKGAGDFGLKSEKAKFLLKSAKTPQSRREALQLIKETFGKDFLVDFIEQEGLAFLPKVSSSTLIPEVIKAPTPTGFKLFQVVTPTVRQEQKPTSQLNVAQGLAQSLGTSQEVGQLSQQLTLQRVGQDITTLQATSQLTAQKTAQKTKQAQKQAQRQAQIQAQKFGRPQRPISKKAGKFFLPILGGPSKKTIEKAKAILKQKGWHGEVKDKGKWRRVTKKPRTKQVADALAMKVADNTTAVSTRLIPTKKNAVKLPRKLRANINKFRDFMIRKGKRIPLKNFGRIEKKKNRIDTKGEKQQLSAAKFLKSKEFKSITKRRRKKPKKVSFF